MALGKFFSVQIGMDFSGGSWVGGGGRDRIGRKEERKEKRKEGKKGEEKEEVEMEAEGKKEKEEGGETKERGKVKPHPLHCE